MRALVIALTILARRPQVPPSFVAQELGAANAL